jgi:hypothetical protein
MADAFWEFYREQAKILDEYKAIFPEKYGKKDCINTLWKKRKEGQKPHRPAAEAEAEANDDCHEEKVNEADKRAHESELRAHEAELKADKANELARLAEERAHEANERAKAAEEKVEKLENEKKEFIKLINELCVKLNNNGGKK